MRGIVPLLIFVLLFAPGLRLLLLAGRTRRMPELLAGLFFLGTALGVPLRLIGHGLELQAQGMGTSVNTAGHLFFGAATCALILFTWRVFRPNARWAQALAGFLLVGQCICTVLVVVSASSAEETSRVILITNSSRVAPLLWAFAESLAYWRMMRRRLALGLADPVVTNRFFLWSVWTGGLAMIPLTTLIMRLTGHVLHWLGLVGGEISGSDRAAIAGSLQIVFLVTGFMGVIALSLSFFPPQRYLDWIRTQSHPKAAPDSPRVRV